MTQFKINDVVTIINNHYNNDDHSFYKEYDFAQIIDITGNHYVLDLHGYSQDDNTIPITASIETLQINKNIHRDFHGYLDEEGLIDTIDHISVYHQMFGEHIKKVETQINKDLQTILSIFNKTYLKTNFDTPLAISNMKDRLFLDFQNTIPLTKDLRTLQDINTRLFHTTYKPDEYHTSLKNKIKEYTNEYTIYENFKI